jgi:DNA-binding MarR family transcriptional regulator
MARKPENSQSNWPTNLAVSADLEEVIEAHYGQFQYHFVEFIVSHLADCSRVFGGDLQEMLVLGLVGQVLLATYNKGAPLDDEGAYGAISASRIADVLGIPRETVRRKLRSLSKRGWIVQTDDAMWKMRVENGVSVAREQLSELDRRGVTRMVKAVQTLRPLLRTINENTEP